MGSVDPALVLGYDTAPASRTALLVAADLALRLPAGHLYVVHAVDLSDYPADPDLPDFDTLGAQTLAVEREHVHAALADLPVPWTYHVGHRRPVRYLCDLAEEHDALMIIVGTRGGGLGSTVARLLDGSVSHGLIRHSRRPVLVVPEHAR
jgi:nucleotide-binding universal stress UspA family protein